MRTKTDCLPDTGLTILGLHRISEGDGHFWYLKALCELSNFLDRKRVTEKGQRKK